MLTSPPHSSNIKKSRCLLLRHQYVWHIIPIILLCAFQIWFTLIAKQYHKYQWWNYVASDFECCPVTSALGLINDGRPVTHIFYPSVTLYNLEAGVLRLATSFSEHYNKIFHLQGFQNIKDVFQMLDEAIRLARLSVVPTMMIFSVLMYVLFYYILRNKWWAFLWTSFLLTEKHVRYYGHVMRPEILTLIAFFCSLLIGVHFLRQRQQQKEMALKKYILCFFTIGLLTGWAVFSKVQIFPALGLQIVFLLYYLWKIPHLQAFDQITSNQRQAAFVCMNALLNMVFFPWWAMWRPDHLTLELLRFWPWNHLYGYPPGKENFVMIPLMVLGGLLLLSFTVLALTRLNRWSRVILRMRSLLLAVNLMGAGLILSVYSVNLLGFTSFSSYMINTHHFVHATFANYYFAGQMNHNVFNIDNWQRIYAQFNASPFFITSLFYVVMGGFVVNIIQLCRKDSSPKVYYIYSLLSLMLGLVFDILATLRAKVYMTNYGIYSVCFYVLGLVILSGVEFRKIKSFQYPWVRKGLIVGISLIFIGHLGQVLPHIHQKSKARTFREGQYPLIYEHCIWQSKFFWDMIDRILYDSEDFKSAREAGGDLRWGNTDQQAMATISKIDQTPQLLTSDDKIGNVDELIVKYTRHLKFKTYLYHYFLQAAMQATAQGQVTQALNYLSKAIKMLPDVPVGHQQRGVLNYQLGHYEQSLIDLGQAQRLGGLVEEGLIKRIKDIQRINERNF